MPDILRRYATPLITGLFLISLVSGVALFFHVGTSAFREMHEILSMVLIAPFVLHLWRNWRAMMNYVGRTPFTAAMAVSLAAAIAFAWPAMTGSASSAGGPPPMALANEVIAHAPKDVAPMLGVSPEEMVSALKDKGFTAATPESPLKEVAKQAGKDNFELMAALVQMKK